MQTRWLNFILSLTNRIYVRKRELVETVGIKGVGNVFVLIFLEIYLAIVSFPLYLGLKSSSVTAFLEEKGRYQKISFDYNLRRVLTLTGVGIFLLVWIIKLAFIVIAPRVYGPLQLYNISNFEPVSVNTEIISAETALQNARFDASLPKPEVKEIQKISGGNYVFSGIGKPQMTLVLLLSERQTAIYSTKVDDSGVWRIEHDGKKFHLNQGNHSVLVYNFDSKNLARSDVSDTRYFTVQTTWLDILISNLDKILNWSLIISLSLGALFTFLTV